MILLLKLTCLKHRNNGYRSGSQKLNLLRPTLHTNVLR